MLSTSSLDEAEPKDRYPTLYLHSIKGLSENDFPKIGKDVEAKIVMSVCSVTRTKRREEEGTVSADIDIKSIEILEPKKKMESRSLTDDEDEIEQELSKSEKETNEEE